MMFFGNISAKSFLGMTSYYRKFIRDYAKKPKPLSNLTRVKANQSKKVPVEPDNEALQVFHDLKAILYSCEVLAFPDFSKPFHFNRSARINYQGLNNFRTQVLQDVRGLIEYRQGLANATHNKTRSDPISYSQGDTVMVASKQIKTKEKQRFKTEEVEENRNVTINTKTGKIFHKSDLRN